MYFLKMLFLAVALISLSACATNIGNHGLHDATEGSINAWLVDGQTTKATVNAKMGVYQDDYSPKMQESMRCKAEQQHCSYGYLDRSSKIHRTLIVDYDAENVVINHKLVTKQMSH
jgi:hypothetical protein